MAERVLLDDAALIAAARAVLNPRRLSPTVEVAGVGAALVSASGAVYRGVGSDAASGIGFCAEHSAIAAKITAWESWIVSFVALDWDGSVLSLCGRCRELIVQVDPANTETRVIMATGVKPVRALLPDHWLIQGPITG